MAAPGNQGAIRRLLASMQVSTTGGAPWSSRVRPFEPLFPHPCCQTHTGQVPLEIPFLRAPSCLSYLRLLRFPLKSGRGFGGSSLVDAKWDWKSWFPGKWLTRLVEKGVARLLGCLGLPAFANPAPTPQNPFSLCHPLWPPCKEAQVVRRSLLSSSGNILAAFSPDIHSRGSKAKLRASKACIRWSWWPVFIRNLFYEWQELHVPPTLSQPFFTTLWDRHC